MIYKDKRVISILGRQNPGAQLIKIHYADGSMLYLMGHPWAHNKVHIYFDECGRSFVDVQTISD